jgi:hypothetical protein
VTRHHVKRKDAGHDRIVAALLASGAIVVDLSNVGAGVPDLMVGRGGRTWLLEVKEEKGALRASQVAFLARWRGGPVALVRTPREALEAVQAVLRED